MNDKFFLRKYKYGKKGKKKSGFSTELEVYYSINFLFMSIL